MSTSREPQRTQSAQSKITEVKKGAATTYAAADIAVIGVTTLCERLCPGDGPGNPEGCDLTNGYATSLLNGFNFTYSVIAFGYDFLVPFHALKI